MLRKSLLNCLLLLLTLTGGTQLWAQGVTTASISGMIADEKGEGLPGATVVAVHTPSGTQYAQITRPDGRYNFPNVRIGGPYVITATFVGFKEQKAEGINLAIGQNFNFSPKMADESTQLTEVVISTSRNPIMNADRTGAGTNISRETIQALPTLSRSFGDYVRLTPQANGTSFGGRSGAFNNITVDGALFNNAFGLSGTVGGQTNAQPISLDAVDQIAVSIAPYDVREGSFTGAGINVVTRSGTNDFSGSAYYFTRNQDFIGRKVAGQENKLANFTLNNYGFRVGGPIIKNKLFFFINAESERRSDPPTPNFVASRSGLPASASNNNVSAASAVELDDIANFLQTKYQFNPGPYENYQLAANSDKATAKIDWNITNQHKLTVKYNYLKSYRDVNPSNSGAITTNPGRQPSNTGLPYLGAFYRINNDLNSAIAELTSSFGSKFANKFQIGYTAFRDKRETPTAGPLFPLVDIGNGQGGQLTAFGYEPFSANNILNTNVFQISDNFDIYLGKHTLTLGTYNEFYKFQNGFAPTYYGNYVFNTSQDFKDNVNGVTRESLKNPATNPEGRVLPARYQLRYSTAADGSFPLVEVRARQLGFYIQDKFEVSPRLNITAGFRADIPTIDADIQRNSQTAGFTFRDGVKILTDKLQKTQVLVSPRVGFNWDVKGDRTMQIRGGTGIFTGRVPYVWLSNQASNNGVLFGAVDYRTFTTTTSGVVSYRPEANFSPNVDAFRPGVNGNPTASASANYNLAVTDDNFKFPQVWRTNLAVDKQLPGGIVASLEFAYTKDINAVYHQNVNLPVSRTTAAGENGSGADKRPIFFNRTVSGTGVVTYPATNRINANITDAIVMRNTNQGYSYFATAQLQKSFANGFYGSLAYTYSDAKSVNDGGSIAQSIWRDRVVSGDPNENVLANAQFLQKHRVIASASYSKEYLGFMKSTLSFFYEVGPIGYFSYVYAGDINGDGQNANDLIYIPRSQSEIALQDIRANSVVVYSAADQWRDLDAYISQDKYLSGRRGQYAERNGAILPWRGQLDMRFLQDFYIKAGGKRNTLQLSVDVFNFANLINSDWGVFQSTNRSALITNTGYSTQGVPQMTFPYFNASNSTVLKNSFQNSFSVGSRWQMQLGVRYIFN